MLAKYQKLTIPWVEVENQLVLSTTNNSLVLLNETAASILRHYCDGYSKESISKYLQEHYRISVQQAMSDIQSLLDNCEQNGFFVYNKNYTPHSRWQKNKVNLAFDKVSLENQAYIAHKLYQINKNLFEIKYSNLDTLNLVEPLFKHLAIDEHTITDKLTKISNFKIGQHGKNYALESNSFGSFEFASKDEFIETLQWLITELGYTGGDWLSVLHSAALGNRNGNSIVLIGQKGSGKSTLTRIMQGHNLIYLADDIVPIDEDGQLTAVPMCQRLKNGSWHVLGLEAGEDNEIYARQDNSYVKYVSPVSGNLKCWHKPWPIKTILYPRFNSSANKHNLKKLTILESLESLCQSGAVFGGNMDQAQLDALIAWLQKIPSYSLSYSIVDDLLVDKIHQLFQ